MSLLDALLLADLVGLALLWALRPRRMGWPFAAALAVTAVLAILQAVVEGFTWQFVAGYGLLALTALLAALDLSARPRLRLLAWLGLAAAAFAALLPFAILPDPTLPAPRGPYAVGTEVFRWVDESRPETATADSTDRRNVVVQAWYPAVAGAPGARPAYIDGLGRLPDQISVLPGFMLSTYGRVDPHALEGAPVSRARDRWPVVLFSPGYGAPRAFYSGLAADLASRGYVVLALDHPYESAVVQLADGHIAANVPSHDPDGDRYMSGQLEIRAADARFVLDQLGRPDAIGPRLSARLDPDRIAMIGHSFGGATAARAMMNDPRLRVGANIDGTLYGTVLGAHLGRPFLLLQSDPAETHHGERFIKGNDALLANLGAPGWRFRIAHANHYSFTDAPNFFAPPMRFVITQVMGGGRGAADTQRPAVDILDAFLSGPLKGKPADPARAAAAYPGIVGGPVS